MEWVTPPELRSGLLVAIITGGRKELKERPTRKWLAGLREYGVNDVVWVMNERHAAEYETDEYPIVAYPESWAYEYAAEHWMHLDPPEPGGFLGAFPGREWACREAEKRGCWGVMQLDDNIIRLGVPRTSGAGGAVVRRHGGMSLYADLLSAVVHSTNGRSVGASLGSVPEMSRQIARPGFPYSLFIERVGKGREPWFGPFEDDITHAYQYGTRGDGATSLLVPILRYSKESASTSGMRGKYDATRAVQLQRIFPESAKIGVRKTHSNGRGRPRVFHTMLNDAIRNPLVVRDAEMFDAVKLRLEALLKDWQAEQLASNRAKVYKRTAGRAR
jgi:hypothetical protein